MPAGMPYAIAVSGVDVGGAPEGIGAVLNEFIELPMLVATKRRVLLDVGMLSDQMRLLAIRVESPLRLLSDVASQFAIGPSPTIPRHAYLLCRRVRLRRRTYSSGRRPALSTCRTAAREGEEGHFLRSFAAWAIEEPDCVPSRLTVVDPT